MTDAERYKHHAGRMQSGVAYEMEGPNDTSTQPKHLKVGINSAHVTDLAVAKLLIAKGVFTEDEYTKAVADAMEEEANAYEKRIQERLGPGVRLGGTLG